MFGIPEAAGGPRQVEPVGAGAVRSHLCDDQQICDCTLRTGVSADKPAHLIELFYD